MAFSDFATPFIAILPETVRGAYLQRGVRPTRGSFKTTKGCECPLTAFLAGGDWVDDLEHKDRSQYVWGFVFGVDRSWRAAEALSPVGRLAYSHGQACWDAVKDLTEGGA